MELNDKEFDAAFRQRVFDADPQFEEAAWDKMERKLRKRERVVLFRKAGLLSLLLLCGLIGYLSFDKDAVEPLKQAELKKDQPAVHNEGLADRITGDKENHIAENQNAQHQNAQHQKEQSQEAQNQKVQTEKTNTKEKFPKADVATVKVKNEVKIINKAAEAQNTKSDNYQYPAVPQLTGLTSTSLIAGVTTGLDGITLSPITNSIQRDSVLNIKKVTKTRKGTLPMSLALNAGPEFNSAGALIGGKTGFSAGLSFSMGITKKMSLQSGIRYSRKDYGADSYAYRFTNARIQDIVSGIDASCDVLEIPILLSYTLKDNSSRSIDINGGISSYLMLKEDYRFRYTPESLRPDRLLEKNNANQHYLSVIDLSATYFMKVKNEKFKIGIEPFLKIPVTGVGEGKMNLKSSGISLKLRYDLNKTNR